MTHETAGPPVPDAFVVRIFGPDGEVAGVGMLVGGWRVVTCAHVVNAALGRATLAQEPPDATVTLDFPLAAPGSAPLTATVVAWVPPPRPGAAGDDVAGLLLTSEPPAGTGPARLGVEPARSGQELLVFGYPGAPPRSDGVIAATTVRDRVGGGRLLLDSGQEAAHRIGPGFSGSPVFDAAVGRVVGMLALTPPGDTQHDAQPRDGYALGADQLRQAWPEALAGRWQRAGAAGRAGTSGGRGIGSAGTGLTILHVSDTQFGQDSLFGGNGLRGGRHGGGGQNVDDHADALFGRLHHDLAGLARHRGLRPDLIVVTGDLTADGLRSEFGQGLRFLAALSEATEIPRRHIAIVPGNHDVNRRACAAYFAEQDSREEPVVPPYFPKWRDYATAFSEFYASVPGVTFTPDEPWTLFEMPELNVVVAGLNSTIAESHLEDSHYGSVAGRQLESFARRLTAYRSLGYLRLAAVHHNVVRGAALDAENLRAAADLDSMLGEPRLLNLLLHGHAHDAQPHSLPSGLLALSTGSAAVEAGARPAEVPSQYQLITVGANGLIRYARRYESRQRRWIGDTRITANDADWRDYRPYKPDRAHVAFLANDASPAQRADGRPESDPEQHPPVTATADRDVYMAGRDLHVTAATGSVPDQRLSGLQLGSHNLQINNYVRSPADAEESFLGRVAEATEARYPTARVIRRPGTDCHYLRISLAPDGGTAEQWPVGILDGPATEAALDAFVTQVHAQFKADDP